MSLSLSLAVFASAPVFSAGKGKGGGGGGSGGGGKDPCRGVVVVNPVISKIEVQSSRRIRVLVKPGSYNGTLGPARSIKMVDSAGVVNSIDGLTPDIEDVIIEGLKPNQSYTVTAGGSGCVGASGPAVVSMPSDVPESNSPVIHSISVKNMGFGVTAPTIEVKANDDTGIASFSLSFNGVHIYTNTPSIRWWFEIDGTWSFHRSGFYYIVPVEYRGAGAVDVTVELTDYLGNKTEQTINLNL
jgi:hypothetical protein